MTLYERIHGTRPVQVAGDPAAEPARLADTRVPAWVARNIRPELPRRAVKDLTGSTAR